MPENNEVKKVMYCDMDKFAKSICKDMRLSEDEANKFIQLLWEQPSIDVTVAQNKLSSCPFCGGEVVINRINHHTDKYRDYWYWCNKCHAYIMIPIVNSKYKGVTETEKEAVEVFNRRVPNA